MSYSEPSLGSPNSNGCSKEKNPPTATCRYCGAQSGMNASLAHASSCPILTGKRPTKTVPKPQVPEAEAAGDLPALPHPGQGWCEVTSREDLAVGLRVYHPTSAKDSTSQSPKPLTFHPD